LGFQLRRFVGIAQALPGARAKVLPEGERLLHALARRPVPGMSRLRDPRAVTTIDTIPGLL